MKKGFITILFSVILSGLTAFGIVKAANPDNSGATGIINQNGQSVKTVNLSLSDYPDFTYAAENAVEAVVFVKVTMKPNQSPFQGMDPFFRFFFGDGYGDQQRQMPEQHASGSGVIIRPDGYIVTNNHVVANATKVEVTLNNNDTYEATVIGTDPATDVALLKVDAKDLPSIQFADSDKLRLGEWVLAIGSPLGEELRSTITAGIVSAKGRQMPGYKGEFKIESFIQTDAAVNPGNSGGALVNKQGELVGINTAIVSTTGSFAGYSFAVPSNIVSKVVADLIDFGSVKRAMLGISMINVDDIYNNENVRNELKINLDELKLSSRDGVYIGEVVKGGAADDAGVKDGDVLVAIDGAKVRNGAAVQEKVNNFHPGDKAVLTIIRKGATKEITVTFKGADEHTGTVSKDGSVAFYGGKIKTADEQTLKKLGIKNGVEIVSAGNGKLAEAGASDGFIIQYVNDQAVKTAQDVVDYAARSRRIVSIEGVSPTGKTGFLAFGKE